MKRLFNIPATLMALREQVATLSDGSQILAKPMHWDKVSWLLNRLANTHHWDNTAGKDDYRSLKMEKLRSLMGKRYADQIMTFLEDNSIIESNNHYSPGSFSKGYRLTEEHRNARKVCVFNADSKFVSKLDAADRTPEGERYLKQVLCQEVGIRYVDTLQELLPGYSDVFTHTAYDGTKYVIQNEEQLALWNDHLAALQLEIEKVPTYLVRKPLLAKGRKAGKHKKRGRKADPQAQLAAALQSAGRIFTQQLVAERDTKGYRLHTNISNLPSRLRKYLVLGGHTELVNTDIPASQLVFACVPLLDFYRERGQVPEDVNRWVQLCTCSDPYARLHLEMYKLTFDEVVEGKYYKLIEEEKEAWTLYRKDFKGWVFQQLYYSEVKFNVGEHTTPESQFMWLNYPSVMRWIVEQKLGDYTAFACNMQRAESKFLIDKFGYQAQVWQLPTVTIHDSAIVPAIYSRQVLDYFQAYFNDQFKDTSGTVRMKAEFYSETAQAIHQKQYELF